MTVYLPGGSQSFYPRWKPRTKKRGILTAPVLMQIAGDDHLVNAGASKSFFERLVVKDKTIHVYDGLYHEVYNEREEARKPVLNDLEAWISSHL